MDRRGREDQEMTGRIVLVLMLSLASTMATPGGAAGVEPAHVSVSARLVVDAADGPILEMELTNREAVPIEMNEAALPWGILNSLFLVAFKLDARQERLQPIIFIDDPGPSVVMIGAGEKLSGRIKLSERFEHLSSLSKKGPL